MSILAEIHALKPGAGSFVIREGNSECGENHDGTGISALTTTICDPVFVALKLQCA